MVDVILGLQWGDEGKGKIVDFFARDYDLVARFQGGPNAGHTLYVDGKLIEKPELPANFTTRRYELCCNYDLPQGKHEVQLKILNPSGEYHIENAEAIYYSDKPIEGMKQNELDASKN